MGDFAAKSDVRAELDAFRAFLRVDRHRGALTVERYCGIVDAFLRGLASPISALSAHDCAAFLRSPTPFHPEPSPSVWNLRLAALRSFVSHLLSRGSLSEDPTAGLRRHRVSSREPVPLSLDELLSVVDAAGRTEAARRNVAVVQTLFHTALRVRELVSLDVGQVEWAARVFRDVRVKGGAWLCAPFNNLVASSLDRYLRTRRKADREASSPLFLSRGGGRLSVRAVQQLVKGLGRAAGILRPVTPHLFRHSNATELSCLGTPISVVQAICGHASPSTTETYIHARSGAERQAIDALGEAVLRRMRARGRPAVRRFA
jgi:integrase/recombinase XerD